MNALFKEDTVLWLQVAAITLQSLPVPRYRRTKHQVAQTISAFRSAGALNAATARHASTLGLQHDHVVKALQRFGIVREGTTGALHLSADDARRSERQTRWLGRIFVGLTMGQIALFLFRLVVKFG